MASRSANRKTSPNALMLPIQLPPSLPGDVDGTDPFWSFWSGNELTGDVLNACLNWTMGPPRTIRVDTVVLAQSSAQQTPQSSGSQPGNGTAQGTPRPLVFRAPSGAAAAAAAAAMPPPTAPASSTRRRPQTTNQSQLSCTPPQMQSVAIANRPSQSYNPASFPVPEGALHTPSTVFCQCRFPACTVLTFGPDAASKMEVHIRHQHLLTLHYYNCLFNGNIILSGKLRYYCHYDKPGCKNQHIVGGPFAKQDHLIKHVKVKHKMDWSQYRDHMSGWEDLILTPGEEVKWIIAGLNVRGAGSKN